MTAFPDRDQRDRLPVAKDGEPTCGSKCPGMPSVPGCIGPAGHPEDQNCRWYVDGREWVEWRPRPS